MGNLHGFIRRIFLVGQELPAVWDVLRSKAERDDEGSEPTSSEQLPSEESQDGDEPFMDMPELGGGDAAMEEAGMEETGMEETGMDEAGMGEAGMEEAGLGGTGVGEAAPRASEARAVKEESDDECQIVGMKYVEDLSPEELQRRFEETSERLRKARLLSCFFAMQKYVKS